MQHFAAQDENVRSADHNKSPWLPGRVGKGVKTPLSSSRPGLSEERKKKPLSAKQAAVAKQKADSARKVREEKERLRALKRQKEQEFLQKSAERRKAMNQASETRKMLFQNQREAKLAQSLQESSGRVLLILELK